MDTVNIPLPAGQLLERAVIQRAMDETAGTDVPLGVAVDHINARILKAFASSPALPSIDAMTKELL